MSIEAVIISPWGQDQPRIRQAALCTTPHPRPSITTLHPRHEVMQLYTAVRDPTAGQGMRFAVGVSGAVVPLRHAEPARQGQEIRTTQRLLLRARPHGRTAADAKPVLSPAARLLLVPRLPRSEERRVGEEWRSRWS